MSNLLLLATLLPVILNFGCILIYIVYHKCRVRSREEGSADWDDVIWFRGEGALLVCMRLFSLGTKTLARLSVVSPVL